MTSTLKSFIIVLVAVLSCTAFVADEGSKKYKCMVQLINYSGEGAYVVISILNEEQQYLKTLKVLGDDDEWYPDLDQWYPHYQKNNQEIDALTGATIAGGERTIFPLKIDEKYFNGTNILRFETAVEDQKYVVDDVRLDLRDGELSGQHPGNGYIRYVKILQQ